MRTRSKLSVSIEATGSVGSSIVAYRATLCGSTYSARTFTTGTLNTAGDNVLTVTVTDARGRTATQTQTISVLDYSPPKLTAFSAERCNADGSDVQMDGANVRITAAATVSDVNGKNSMSAVVYFRLAGTDTWETALTLEPDAYSVGETNRLLTQTFDTLRSYELKLRVTDAFYYVEQMAEVGTKQVIIDLYHDGTGMNIPKTPWMFGMDETNENHIVLCAENQLTEGAFRETATTAGWSVEVGGAEVATILEKFNKMVSFVKDTDTETEFRNGFASYLDLDACLNYYCFAYLLGATDNLGKNMLMTTRDGNVWAPSLYDLDSLFGVQWDGIRQFAADSACPAKYQCNNSLLWQKIEEYYLLELCERYMALRKGALSLENINRHWDDFVGSIPETLYEYDARRWLGIRQMHRTLAQTKAWIAERASYVDEIFQQKYNAATGAPELVLHEDDFISTGSAYLDTTQQLFTGDYPTATLFVRIKPASDGTVYFSAFSERYPDPGYKGLLCRQVTTKLALQISGDTASISASDMETSEIANASGYIEIAIVKKLDSYFIYVNGSRVAFGTVDVPTSITETLLLGAQWDAGGEPFRMGTLEIPVFERWHGCFDKDEITAHFKEI